MPAGRGTSTQGSRTGKGGTGRGAARQAWPGKQAGWVAAEAIRTRAGDQSKPPAHQQSGEERPGQLSFAVLQPERQSIPGPGRRGSPPYTATEGKPGAATMGTPIFRERPAEATLPSFIHPFTQQVFKDPMSVPGSMLGTGDTAVSKTKPLPKVWGQRRQHTR